MEEKIKELEEKVNNLQNVVYNLTRDLYNLSIARDSEITFSDELEGSLQEFINDLK